MPTEGMIAGGGPKNDTAGARRARKAGLAARDGDRRRGVDPCTTDRDYSDAEREFLMAMDRYRAANRRRFPTWSEALEVLISLGYRKVATPAPLPTADRAMPDRPAGGRW